MKPPRDDPSRFDEAETVCELYAQTGAARDRRIHLVSCDENAGAGAVAPDAADAAMAG